MVLKQRYLLLSALIICTQCCQSLGWLWTSASPSKVDIEVDKIIHQQVLDMPEAEQAESQPGNDSILGAPPSQQEKYKQAIFTCDDGKKTIASSSINDDYCDCDDGTDEPGTSACAGRLSARFYCTNIGFKSMYIPSSKVGDGICDCCDGSDEIDNPYGVVCENECDEVGKKWREEQARIEQARGEGIEKRRDYIRRGEVAAATREKRKKELQDEIDALSPNLRGLEDNIKELEEQESCTSEGSVSELYEQRVNALGLEHLDVAQLHRLIINLAVELDAGDQVAEMISNQLSPHYDEDGGEDTDEKTPQNNELENEDMELIDSIHWIHSDVEEVEESEELQAARAKMDEIVDKKTLLEEKLKSIDDEESEDFGNEKEFWVLKGECFESKADQYVYKICMYGAATQDSVSLGKWDGFDNDHSVMKFTNGAKCWNGPKRSMTISVECGAEEMFHSISEPNTCEYVGKFSTPAACS
mmetsp:Transcript_4175/g.5576  ORF Transcript_4175/g.5576 Transcript_4175/m.5576 type:complete len:473 (+) Transcript_4175:150-1568(+)